jgi:hypothetical protein
MLGRPCIIWRRSHRRGHTVFFEGLELLDLLADQSKIAQKGVKILKPVQAKLQSLLEAQARNAMEQPSLDTAAKMEHQAHDSTPYFDTCDDLPRNSNQYSESSQAKGTSSEDFMMSTDLARLLQRRRWRGLLMTMPS